VRHRPAKGRGRTRRMGVEGKDVASGVEGSSKQEPKKKQRKRGRLESRYWEELSEEPAVPLGGALWSEEEQRARIRMGDPEWELAWRRLAAVTGEADLEARHPLSGRCWGYIGSDASPPSDEAPQRLQFQHVFRHRHHPRTGCWHEVQVDASEGWPYSDGGADGPKTQL
jgi:hypothetical protein